MSWFKNSLWSKGYDYEVTFSPCTMGIMSPHSDQKLTENCCSTSNSHILYLKLISILPFLGYVPGSLTSVNTPSLQASHMYYSKTCVKRPLSKRPKIVFWDELLFNAGQKYCRMLQGEHSAILSTFIKLPFVIKIIVLSIFEWRFYTGFTVPYKIHIKHSYYCFILIIPFTLTVIGWTIPSLKMSEEGM